MWLIANSACERQVKRRLLMLPSSALSQMLLSFCVCADVRTKYKKWFPSGKKLGNRCEFSAALELIAVTVSASPPEALTRRSGPLNVGAKRMTLSMFHDPPLPTRAELTENGGAPVGLVTSGAPSPTLGKSIGLAYVPPELAAMGTRLDVSIRGRAIPACVVETPFVKAPG